jgi:hypothetical protein
MRSERGQASVEWIVLVLLLALAVTALARFAPQADPGDLGAELLSAVTCAAGAGCKPKRDGHGPASGWPASGTPGRLVTAPPLLPLAPRTRGVTRSRLRLPRFAPLVGRAGRRAGVLWRRSWILCLGYERVRYSVLHPEIRFPNANIPMSEGVRIANDCLSPADVIRDFGRPSKP